MVIKVYISTVAGRSNVNQGDVSYHFSIGTYLELINIQTKSPVASNHQPGPSPGLIAASARPPTALNGGAR
jgi:hypothetical protein